MSFYGSQPTPNISTQQPPPPQSLDTNAWSTTPLDQLVFQDQDNPLNPMGGLRRQTPQPQTNDPNFSIVDAATAELAAYPSDHVSNDRFLFDSARLEFDAAIQRRQPTNHVDQRHKLHRPQPTPAYQQQWDRPQNAITASNATALSPEAFEIADELGINTSGPPENFAARSKHATPLSTGKYLQTLINFNREQHRYMLEGTLERHWKSLLLTYFTPEAAVHIALKSNSSPSSRAVKLPVEALPRLWKAKVEAGMTNERMLFEDPREFQYPNGVVTVDCPRTIIITTYQHRIVHTDGYLRVSFHRNGKIAEWQFSSQKHDECFTRKQAIAGLNYQLPMNFGVPDSVVRVLMIANDIYTLKDRVNDEISALLSDPRRLRGMQGYMNAVAARQEASLPNFQANQTGQNGNAFKTLRSVLDGNQLDQGIANSLAPTMGRGNAAGQTGRALHGDLDIDIKAELESESNVVPNLREAFNSWKSEPQSSVMFPQIFDETMRSSLIPGNTANVQNNVGQGHGDLNLNPRKGGPVLGEARTSQHRQSAIDAVTAVASGQGGWGIAAPSGPTLGSTTSPGEELDRNLQLLSAAPDEFVRRNESGSTSRGNAQGQTAPPGLAVFTPQASDSARGSEPQSRRARSSGGSRGAGGTSGRTAAGGQGMKEFENYRAMQRRISSSKSKRDTTVESGHNGSGAGSHGDFAGTSQGLTDQNRTVGNVKTTSRAENAKIGKERNPGGTGTRRSASRNTSTDERMEKRQKTTAQNGEQR